MKTNLNFITDLEMLETENGAEYQGFIAREGKVSVVSMYNRIHF